MLNSIIMIFNPTMVIMQQKGENEETNRTEPVYLRCSSQSCVKERNCLNAMNYLIYGSSYTGIIGKGSILILPFVGQKRKI